MTYDICETLEDLKVKPEAKKGAIESKQLRVNPEKTETIVGGENAESYGRRQVSLQSLQKMCRQ